MSVTVGTVYTQVVGSSALLTVFWTCSRVKSEVMRDLGERSRGADSEAISLFKDCSGPLSVKTVKTLLSASQDKTPPFYTLGEQKVRLLPLRGCF